MRRTPAELALSPTMRTRPMSPVRRTCVPPQSSTDQALLAPGRVAPIDTTRTSSPYFSPKSAMAPEARASSSAISRVTTGVFSSSTALAMSSTAFNFFARHRLRVREVEAQPLGRDERALLRDVRAEHLTQRLVQQMRRGVVGARRCAARVIDFELDGVAGLEAALLDLAESARKDRRASSAYR